VRVEYNDSDWATTSRRSETPGPQRQTHIQSPASIAYERSHPYSSPGTLGRRESQSGGSRRTTTYERETPQKE